MVAENVVLSNSVAVQSANRSAVTWSTHGGVLSTLINCLTGRSVAGASERKDDFSQTILEFVEHHGLAVFWLHYLRTCPPAPTAAKEPAVFARLVALQREAMALYLAQSRAIQELTLAFDQTGIQHALIKGPAWRDEIYDQPYARTATDVDLLIDESSLAASRQQLADLGFVCATQGSRGHEETWVRGSVDIDLHWQILAPGRMPKATVANVLGRRLRVPRGFWRLCNDDMVAVSLMHLAVSKYVCSQHAGLNRVLDLLLAARRLSIDWQLVAEAIRRARLGGAAWATLHWIDVMAAAARADYAAFFPPPFSSAIRPAALRARYLAFWIDHNLPGKLEPRVAWLVRYAFTLPMHDTLSAAGAAAAQRLRGRKP